MHGVWLLVLVAAVPWMLRMIPIASLAAILVFTGYKLVNVQNVKRLLRYGGPPVVIYMATVISIVCTDLLKGIIVGLTLSILQVIYARTHFKVRTQLHAKANRMDVYLEGTASFLRLPMLADALEALPLEHETHVHFRDCDYVDDACLEVLSIWQQKRIEKGSVVVLEWDEALRLYRDKNPLGSTSGRTSKSRPHLTKDLEPMRNLSFTKILVPFDFSERAEEAARYANRFCGPLPIRTNSSPCC